MESESERNSSTNPSKQRRPRLTVSNSPAKPNFQKPPIQPHLTAQFNQNISCANSTTSSLKSDSSFFPRASYNSVPPTPDCLDEGIMAALIELENNKTNFNMSNAVKSLRRSSDDELDSAEGGSGGGSGSAGRESRYSTSSSISCYTTSHHMISHHITLYHITLYHLSSHLIELRLSFCITRTFFISHFFTASHHITTRLVSSRTYVRTTSHCILSH